MKRKWPKTEAIDWITKVAGGKAPQGLKYCSAVSFLRKCMEGNA